MNLSILLIVVALDRPTNKLFLLFGESGELPQINWFNHERLLDNVYECANTYFNCPEGWTTFKVVNILDPAQLVMCTVLPEKVPIRIGRWCELDTCFGYLESEIVNSIHCLIMRHI